MRSPFGAWNISFMASAYLYLCKQKRHIWQTGKKNEGGILAFTSHFTRLLLPAIDNLKMLFSNPQ